MDTMSAPEACCKSATTPRSTADRPEFVSTWGRILFPGDHRFSAPSERLAPRPDLLRPSLTLHNSLPRVARRSISIIQSREDERRPYRTALLLRMSLRAGCPSAQPTGR